ncbi:MAG: class I SAM-dependent methyltransferase [Cyclobacteriaceae bacterium]|nr:class I SAM-dependent methyltransferase [Cyclobacteriaceae bacterium]MCH8517447.1 class I SAM-dependent methyltransferase [Cyclobacteriaceae bacterium]
MQTIQNLSDTIVLKYPIWFAYQKIIHFLYSVDWHSLQNPTLFSFYKNVCKRLKTDKVWFEIIESYRKDLLNSETSIKVKRCGAPSRVNDSPIRDISQLTASSSSSLKKGRFIYWLNQWMNPDICIEFGTALGIGTAYLAMESRCPIISIECCKNQSNLAKSFIDKHNMHHVHLVVANIDEWINQNNKLVKNKKVLAILDANHKYQPTLDYVNFFLKYCAEDSILVIDDIYWSKEMYEAWQKTITHPSVKYSLDFFDFGMLWCGKPMIQKLHYKIEH